MKTLKKAICMISIALLMFTYGCNRDDLVSPIVDVPVTNEGAYILSEGTFGISGSTALSFYDRNSGNFFENIFNPGELGIFPDGLIYDNSQLYISEQGNFGSAGKIYMTDSTGTVLMSSNVGTNPYSLAISNNKIYLTNGPANNVTVIDKNTFSPITTIPVGLYPQEILAVGSKVFVCNTSVFMGGTDSTVSVIDAATDFVTVTIKVRQTPSSLAISNDGNLLIGCPGPSAVGIIYKYDISNYTRLDSFVISNGFASGFDKDMSVDASSNFVYFISYLNNISRVDMSTKVASLVINNSNTTTTYFNGYKFDDMNRIHYVADAKNFNTRGSLYIYDINGTF
jgi:YVTN family beta-propeller protein